MEKLYNCCEFLTPFSAPIIFAQKHLYFITFHKIKQARETVVSPGLRYSNIAMRLGAAYLYIFKPYGPLKILDVTVYLSP